MNFRYRILMTLLLALVAVAAALSIGSRVYSPGEIWDILTGPGDSIDFYILYNLRMSRIAMALIAGAALSVSGVMFQAILRNPLADPYVIGVSGGAALGASIAIVFSLSNGFVVAFAFLGSLLAVTLVFVISRRLRVGTASLLLAGISLGFIFYASVLLIFSWVRSEEVHKAMLWLMGDLTIARYEILTAAGIITAVILIFTLFFHKHLDVISFGERFSRGLGVSGLHVRIVFWTGALLAAITVSLCGVIGFVGLIVPHLFRMIFGPGHLRLIPAAALGGGIFLMVSDTIGRSAATPYEIPVGVVTAFFGGIFFLAFIIRRRSL